MIFMSLVVISIHNAHTNVVQSGPDIGQFVYWKNGTPNNVDTPQQNRYCTCLFLFQERTFILQIFMVGKMVQ